MKSRETLHIEDGLVSYNEKLEKRSVESVDTVVIHCTELPDEESCLHYAKRVLYESGTGNCGHFYIFRKGRCVQYASLDRVAHHVVGHNEKSVGIELANRGRYPHWFHRDHQEMTEPYTEEQYETLGALLAFLSQELSGWKGRIVGHSDLDERWIPAADDPSHKVRRKMDPGPLFDWQRVQEWKKSLIQ